jgi:CBS domain containing-hemolysin-like protein
MFIREANRKFRLKLPESDNYTTVAGFLIARAGRLLNQGDAIEYGGAKFTVERVASRRVTRVKMEHLHEPSNVDGDAPSGERK